MHFFQYRKNLLHCEDVPVDAIAREVETPFYLYSYGTMERHYRVFDSAFKSVPHLVCYSLKANSNIALIRIFGRLGSGADVVSGGELFRALRAGIPPSKIVFSGVGKTGKEIEYALENGILLFNVESLQELSAIDERARQMGVRARIALRINPDVDPRTHPHISTGLRENKFGIAFDQALSAYRFAKELKNLDVIGIDCHIGSQLIEVGPFVEALKRLKELVRALEREGIEIRHMDLGGGLGITYQHEAPPHPTEYGQAILREMEDLDVSLIFEPGRVIVGNAGILVTRVLYTKRTPQKIFVIVDAGMNDLIRPPLYGSFQAILPVVQREGKEIVADVVGPICESSDFFARGRKIIEPQEGDLLAIMSAGAYGFAMSSNYNSRTRVCEVLAKGETFSLIRERETHDDLIRGERIPEFLA
ncbi:MAG: diaminopimelate decarboxylase [Proteobacteria bacterium]|nr:diaminopimelate decarboxylase [Pseudomonadota bacterium]